MFVYVDMVKQLKNKMFETIYKLKWLLGVFMSLSKAHILKIKSNISVSVGIPKPFFLIVHESRYVFHVGKSGTPKKYGNITLVNQQLAKKKWADPFPPMATQHELATI